MSQPFSFPPPPPPPPRPRQETTSTPDYRGGFRGRGGSRGCSRGSGPPTRGRGSYGNQNAQRPRGNFNQRSFAPAPKRDFQTAFTQQPQQRPKAPPATPSFDVDIKSLLPSRSSPPSANPVKKRVNLLGLTPARDASDSEDDADDETKLAATVPDNGLHFEHKGQKLSLRTPADIAAWIAERKKRFPTALKIEAAKREAEAKKKQWEEDKPARDEQYRLKREAREKERNERERQKVKDKAIAAQVAKAKSAVANSKEDVALKAKHKADKLRKKAEKAAKELQIAEEQLRVAEQGSTEKSSIETTDLEKDEEVMDDNTNASTHSEDSDTSSSGSSDMDSSSDSDPEETTSKRVGPERVAPPKQTLRNVGNENAVLCKNLTKYGRCKYGKNCRFSHKIVKDRSKQASITPSRRKGLYQVLVEKEQEDELKRALNTIIMLGERGILDEPTTAASVSQDVNQSMTDTTSEHVN